MYFRQFHDTTSAAMSYLIADSSSGVAVAIDPTPDPCQGLVLKALLAERGFALALILLTHTHGGVADDFLAHYPGTGIVVGPQGPLASVGRQASHGEVLGFGGESIRVIATPGHTADSLSYLWRDRLFCGDALALGGCPLQTDDEDCDPRSIYDSVVDRLFTLPAETLVFPGHDAHGRTVSTIGEERSRNPFFLARSRDAFVTAFRSARGAPSRGLVRQ
jgi:glyoxylase-like metal-dependent hydrolase (beta-lactamase superfamily II)